VCIDLSLSSDDCILTAKKWLHIVNEKIAALEKLFGVGTGSDGGAESSSTSMYSVIIVGYNADRINVDDVSLSRNAKRLQGTLRAMGLAARASLVFTSASTGVNIGPLRNFIINSLFPENFTFPPEAKAISVSADALLKRKPTTSLRRLELSHRVGHDRIVFSRMQSVRPLFRTGWTQTPLYLFQRDLKQRVLRICYSILRPWR
jgi:hypothetical protein